MEELKKFSTDLKYFMKASKVTVKKLAQDTTISEDAIKKYRADKRLMTLENAFIFAQYFGISIELLIDHRFEDNQFTKHADKFDKSSIQLVRKENAIRLNQYIKTNQKLNDDKVLIHSFLNKLKNSFSTLSKNEQDIMNKINIKASIVNIRQFIEKIEKNQL